MQNNERRARILVAYASRAGSTQEIAEFVAGVLREQGATVDVQPVKKVGDVADYTAVVVGSGIRMGKVLPESVKFMQRHAGPLEGKPVAYFVVCMTLKRDTLQNRETVSGYLAPLRAIREPVGVGMFSGVVNYARLGLITGFFIKKAAEDPNTKDGDILQEGDFRDWDAIRAWAEFLLPTLHAA